MTSLTNQLTNSLYDQISLAVLVDFLYRGSHGTPLGIKLEASLRDPLWHQLRVKLGVQPQNSLSTALLG